MNLSTTASFAPECNNARLEWSPLDFWHTQQLHWQQIIDIDSPVYYRFGRTKLKLAIQSPEGEINVGLQPEVRWRSGLFEKRRCCPIHPYRGWPPIIDQNVEMNLGETSSPRRVRPFEEYLDDPLKMVGNNFQNRCRIVMEGIS